MLACLQLFAAHFVGTNGCTARVNDRLNVQVLSSIPLVCFFMRFFLFYDRNWNRMDERRRTRVGSEIVKLLVDARIDTSQLSTLFVSLTT